MTDVIAIVAEVLHKEYSVREGNVFEQHANAAGMTDADGSVQIKWVARYFSSRLARCLCPVPVIDMNNMSDNMRAHINAPDGMVAKCTLDGPLIIRLWFVNELLPKIKKYKLSL